jgi:dTDP-4-dehydrorhamnose 3,5-epimerase
MIRATPTRLPEVLLIEPQVHGDDRGFFLESYNERDFAKATGLAPRFVQDNHSRSRGGVVRGLHYQVAQPQGKLVRVAQGRIFDVAVDLRRHSPRLGQWVGVELSEQNRRQLWIPAGFAHGFLVLSAHADLLYKTTDYYAPALERALAWDDSRVGVTWPLAAGAAPVLSARDAAAPRWDAAELFD